MTFFSEKYTFPANAGKSRALVNLIYEPFPLPSCAPKSPKLHFRSVSERLEWVSDGFPSFVMISGKNIFRNFRIFSKMFPKSQKSAGPTETVSTKLWSRPEIFAPKPFFGQLRGAHNFANITNAEKSKTVNRCRILCSTKLRQKK